MERPPPLFGPMSQNVVPILRKCLPPLPVKDDGVFCGGVDGSLGSRLQKGESERPPPADSTSGPNFISFFLHSFIPSFLISFHPIILLPSLPPFLLAFFPSCVSPSPFFSAFLPLPFFPSSSLPFSFPTFLPPFSLLSFLHLFLPSNLFSSSSFRPSFLPLFDPSLLHSFLPFFLHSFLHSGQQPQEGTLTSKPGGVESTSVCTYICTSIRTSHPGPLAPLPKGPSSL